MIRIGIVGCGRILNAHLQGYLKLRQAGIDNFRITALVARREDDARMFVRRGEGPPPRPPVTPPEAGDPLGAPHTYLSDFQDDVEVRTYTDYRAMIDDGVVDAVNDFTTLDLHHQVAEAAFKAGQHLLTQKPLAISVAAAQQMVRQAQAAGVTLGTFENVRNGAFTRAAGWAVRRGLLGEPQMAITGSVGGLWSPDVIVAQTPWRHRKLLGGGGGSIDIGVHLFHMLRYVFGEVAWIGAVARTFEKQRYRRDENGQVLDQVEADVDDTFFASAGFANEAIAQILWSWAGRGEPLQIGDAPAFYGSEGCIKGGELIDNKGNRTPLLSTFEQQMSDAEREQFFPLGLKDTFALQQLDWLRAIEAGTEPETSGREGLHDLACAFAILESSVLRHQVTLDEMLSGAADIYQREINEHYGLTPQREAI
jgi:1,5-anhydro-D-fructose reductase (1,5-anhydro-D-mannitol-forming)